VHSSRHTCLGSNKTIATIGDKFGKKRRGRLMKTRNSSNDDRPMNLDSRFGTRIREEAAPLDSTRGFYQRADNRAR